MTRDENETRIEKLEAELMELREELQVVKCRWQGNVNHNAQGRHDVDPGVVHVPDATSRLRERRALLNVVDAGMVTGDQARDWYLKYV